MNNLTCFNYFYYTFTNNIFHTFFHLYKCLPYHKNMLLIDLFTNVFISDILHFLASRENKQIFNDIPRQDAAISLEDSYLELDFNVTHRAGAHDRHVDNDHIRLVNLDTIALFNKYRLTNSSGEEIEEIDKAHVICLMHKLLPSSRDSDDYQLVSTEIMQFVKEN